MLVTMTARLVRSHGTGDTALPGSGRIEYTPAAHGVYMGALRGTDPVPSEISDGVAKPVELTPGTWRVSVWPDDGGTPWEPWLIELTEGMPEPVDLVDLAPVVVVDGEKWSRGGRGPTGTSVTGAREVDGELVLALSDGTETAPVPLPPGPQGVGVESISDPDGDSVVTVTYTDGSTSTVQAIVGAAGDDGHTPVLSWAGTVLVVDGVAGPDLEGRRGLPGDLVEVSGTLTRGTATTGGALALTATGTARALTVTAVAATGSSESLAVLAPEDAGHGVGWLVAAVGADQHWWPVTVSGTQVLVHGPVTAGHSLSGSLEWRTT